MEEKCKLAVLGELTFEGVLSIISTFEMGIGLSN